MGRLRRQTVVVPTHPQPNDIRRRLYLRALAPPAGDVKVDVGNHHRFMGLGDPGLALRW